MKSDLIGIIKKYSGNKNYFSLDQLRIYLASLKLNYSDITIKKYLKELIDRGIIYSAGRGYYSTLPKTIELGDERLITLVNTVKQKYPLIKFSAWSTKSFSFAFHHMQNSFYYFLFAEKDSLIFLRDFLSENKYDVYLNPLPDELDKNVILKNGTIILRPLITRGKEKHNFASIEQILVDLCIEKDRLRLIDDSEFNHIFSYVFDNFRISLSALLTYAGRRKIRPKIKLLLQKYTNAAFN